MLTTADGMVFVLSNLCLNVLLQTQPHIYLRPILTSIDVILKHLLRQYMFQNHFTYLLVFIDLLHLLEWREWQFLSPTVEQAVRHGLRDAKDDTQYKFYSCVVISVQHRTSFHRPILRTIIRCDNIKVFLFPSFCHSFTCLIKFQFIIYSILSELASFCEFV